MFQQNQGYLDAWNILIYEVHYLVMLYQIYGGLSKKFVPMESSRGLLRLKAFKIMAEKIVVMVFEVMCFVPAESKAIEIGRAV